MNALLSYQSAHRFHHIISRFRLFCCATLACAWTCSPAGAATVILNDSGTHVFNYAADNVLLSNSTTVNVQAGAQTTPGTDIYGDGLNGILSSGNSTVNVYGGALSGGNVSSGSPSYHDGGAGVYSSGGSVALSGGLLQGGTGVYAGVGLLTYGALVNVIDGTAVGGNSSQYWAGYGIDVYSSTNLTMTGGTVYGGNGAYAGGGIRASSSIVNISGGTIYAGTSSYFPGSGFSLSASNAHFTITGGLFTGGFQAGTYSIIDVWGTGLAYSGDNYHGTLSGYLQNGGAINVPVSLYGCSTLNINGTFAAGTSPDSCTVSAVPLPGAVWLLASGLPLLLVGNISRLVKRRRE